MKRFFLTLAMTLAACFAFAASGPGDIIPSPVISTLSEGTFTLPESPAYYIAGEAPELEKYLMHSPLNFSGKASKSSASVTFIVGDKKLASELSKLGVENTEEAFSIEVGARGVRVRSVAEAGAFYAVQALVQMTSRCRTIQQCKITDYPAYAYRGAMFDISRHYRDKEFILKQIDALALVRINNLHLHLTDDAGWRIQIDAFPQLTSKSAWREGATWKDWEARGTRYLSEGDRNAYGGYLTKDEVREIIAYAAERHINIVPEIEMPGHSKEVFAAFPELECQGVDHPFATSDLCPGNEKTYEIFEKIFTEIIDLFPSKYIHLGGDEASKLSWQNCPLCQKKMQEEGLKDVDELQSYLVTRMGEFIASKGRQMVGWDEIIDGGLAPGAVVMSWRGSEPGIKAMQMGHDVIMSPSSHYYLDYYQDAPLYEPEAIGGFIPLSKAYSYNPREIEADESCTGRILGIQANLWAEYIPSGEQYEYMLYPRLFALAEVAWGKAQDASYDEFRARAEALGDYLRANGFNAFDLHGEFGERPESKTPVTHLALGCPVTYNGCEFPAKYSAGGTGALTDGLRGGWTYSEDKWQGFNSDLDVTVDLGKECVLHYLSATFLSQMGAWVGMPAKVEYFISDDGENFEKAGEVLSQVPHTTSGYMQFGLAVNAAARYVRLKAVRSDKPHNDWLFLDEIIVQ